VGVVIGAAFGKIVSSFVADIIMPPLGLAIGGVDFSKLVVVLKANPDPAQVVALRYGVFLQAIFDFAIIAFAIFLVVKLINRVRAEPPPASVAPPAPTPQELLLTEIRDLLRERR
jgi:large conductance mechanosensitive channel